MNTYAEAAEYLGRKLERPIANNTRLVRRSDNEIAVRLHATDVVTYRSDGTAILNSGGWLTVTTKDRLNNFSPARVWSERGKWNVYVTDGVTRHSQRYVDAAGVDRISEWVTPNVKPAARFFDGIIVDSYGRPMNAPAESAVEAQERQERATVARIRKYVKGYIAELRKGMPAPTGGDCWYCAMFDRVEARPERDHYGMTTADSARSPQQGNTEHLESHISDAETYYVPSLALNALRYVGMRDVGIAISLRIGPPWHDAEHMGGPNVNYETVQRALTRYLKARLVPGLAR